MRDDTVSSRSVATLTLIIGIIVGAGLTYLVTSTGGIARATMTSIEVSTVTNSTSVTISASYAVNLTGCSISNKTCTFLVSDVPQPGDHDITLAQGNQCLWLNFASTFVSASGCVVSPSQILSQGSSATIKATFLDWGTPSPTVGESVKGCITEKYAGSVGCLPFLGSFTP